MHRVYVLRHSCIAINPSTINDLKLQHADQELQSYIYILTLCTRIISDPQRGISQVPIGLEVQVQSTTGWSPHLLREKFGVNTEYRIVKMPGHHQVEYNDKNGLVYVLVSKRSNAWRAS